MNIRDLKYLIAVAETEHFGRAAERCFVSQPTLSTQLKKLEEELGVMLFERNNKQVLITPVGEAVVQQARQVIMEVNKLKHIAQNAKDPLAGKFRLGIIPTLGPYLLPHVLHPLKKQLPHLELHVIENKTEVILRDLKQGELDAVILALPVSADHLVVQELFREPFYVALPKGHPLGKQKTIKIDSLETETLLLLEEGHCLREQALEACRYMGARDQIGFTATSLETLRHVVGAGAGITLLPALAVKAASQDPNIIIKPFVGPMPSRRVGMLWRKSSLRGKCCKDVAKLITQQVSKEKYLQVGEKLKPMKKQLV